MSPPGQAVRPHRDRSADSPSSPAIGFLARLRRRTRGLRPTVIRVIPTCIEATQAYSLRSPDNGDDDGTTRLVWIGSSSTLQGLEAAAAPAWNAWAARFRGPEIAGHLRPVPQISARYEVESDRLVRRDRSAADLARAATWGSPSIPDDLWTRGASAVLKVLQFFAAGLPVVANPVGVHPEMVDPRPVNGSCSPATDDALGRRR